jgi:hypothetical protein
VGAVRGSAGRDNRTRVTIRKDAIAFVEETEVSDEPLVSVA